MLHAILLATLGITLTLTIGSFKKKQMASAYYWISILLLQIAQLYLPDGMQFGVFGLLFFLGAYLHFLFSSKPHFKNWIVYVLLLPPLLLLLEQFQLGKYFLTLVIALQGMALLKQYRELHRKKGIVLKSNAGKKAWLIFGFVSANFLLAIGIVLTSWLSPFMILVQVAFLLLSTFGLYTLLRENPWGSWFESNKYEKSPIDAAEKCRLSTAIDQVFRSGDFHTSFQASLGKLAELVHGTTHQVSQVINESKGMTFGELLAYHRIRDAKKLLSSPRYDHLSVEGIAAEVGYASKAAFNKAFRKFTAQSPAAFRESSGLPDQGVPPATPEFMGNRESTATFESIKNSQIMFTNFLKIYLRNLLKNKPLSLINIAGLTLGITSTLLIAVYLRFETSYDTFHSRSEDLYRIIWNSDNAQTRTPHPMAQALVNDFPQVESAVSLSPVYGPGLTLQSIYIRNPENNRMFQEPDIFFADSTFFEVFDFSLTRGEKKSVLAGPGDIVLTESIAEKYFGEEDPIGKRIEFVEYDFVTEVTGVMKDPPTNSHFHPQLLVSYMSRKYADPGDPWMTWEDFGHFNYVRLAHDANPVAIENEIPDWVTGYRDFTEGQLEAMKQKRAYFDLQPVTDIHLHSDVRWELESNGNILYVYILLSAILFLIVISIINYVNLSTARAMERTKEVGIRKSLGAAKRGISFQFIMEAITTCLIALILSYALAIAFFGEFNTLVGKSLSSGLLFSPIFLLGSLGLTVLIGFLAGIYPSLYISKLKPLEILKGKSTHNSNGIGIRRVLLATQFIVAGIMIFGSVTVYQQIQYIQNKELGFDNDELLVLELHTNEERARIDAIKNEINGIDGVIGCGGISNLPGSQFNQNEVYRSNQPEISASFSELGTDFDALQLLGLELHSGRWFERSNGQDTALSNFIINEAAVRALNLNDSIFDIPLTWNTEVTPQEGRVVGVVDDFHFKSLHRAVQPLIVLAYPSASNYLLVRIEAGKNPTAIIEQLKGLDGLFDPVFELDYYFLDDLVDSQYNADYQTLSVLQIFSGIALFLSALGLLGLAYLSIAQKTKEIGIRRVLGANTGQLITKENVAFIKTVGAALLVALPTAYFVMTEWLNRFEYRNADFWLPAVLTVLILIGITICCVTLAIAKTTTQNPTNALKHE